mmetsp:Transcript_35900/g.44550  ORF Transcript_35900/g.44550 Transcript_35900/m.44550 type:complete len:251 (+) Transcript_35900:2445-3197(+)
MKKKDKEELKPFVPGGTSKSNDLRTNNRIFLFSKTNAHMSKEEVKNLIQKSKCNNRQKFLSDETKRNMLTSPAKRGTYGYCGILLSDKPGSKYKPYSNNSNCYGKGTESLEREVARKERENHKQKIGERPPFCSMVKPSRLTFSSPKEGCPASISAKNSASKDSSAKIKRKPPTNEKRAFRPSGVTHKALYSDYPKYMPQSTPSNAKPQVGRNNTRNQDKPCWKPGSTGKTHQVRSIFLNNRNIGWPKRS